MQFSFLYGNILVLGIVASFLIHCNLARSSRLLLPPPNERL